MVYSRIKYSLPSCLTLAINHTTNQIAICIYIYIYIYIYAQALRLRRICSKETFFESRARNLCSFLEERGSEKNVIQQQVDRARQTPRDEALRDKPRKENTRIPFTVTYYPGLPNIGGMLRNLHPVHKCPVLATRSLLSFFILSSTLLRGVEVWKSPTK